MKKGWQAKKLGDVCDFEGGSQPPKSEFIYDEKPGYVRFLQIRDFGSDKNITYIRHSKKNRLCNENDILIGRYGASVGKILTNKAGAYNVALMKTIPNLEVLDQSWFYHFLVSDEFQTPLLNVADRSAQAGFSKDDIYNFPVPVPPLAEQQRIVGLVDEAFEGLATSKANAEKNLQNSRALFESHLQSVFTQRGTGWVEKSLGEVCVVKDGTHDSPKYVTDGIPFVTQKNIREDGLSFERIKFISQEDHDDFYRRSNAAHGDILISMIGANRGMACIVDDERTFSIKNVGLVKQNPSINQEFLLYFLKSPQAAGFVKGASKGGAQEFVGLTELRRFPVPLPPLERQNALAETFQSLREETQRLARLYERKLAALEALKKSLLHQAFSGEL